MAKALGERWLRESPRKQRKEPVAADPHGSRVQLWRGLAGSLVADKTSNLLAELRSELRTLVFGHAGSYRDARGNRSCAAPGRAVPPPL